jgi:hypothetical protein
MAAEVGPGPSSDAILAEKVVWAASMRRQFSPEGMCHEDGSINQDFFKPKKIIIQLTEDKKWGQPEKEALYKVGRTSLKVNFHPFFPSLSTDAHPSPSILP